MFLEVRNFQTTSDVWAGVLSWWRNQLLFFHLSGRLRQMPSLSCFKNLTVKLAADSLTSRYEFLVDSALDVEKNNQHGHDIAANLTRFFQAR